MAVRISHILASAALLLASAPWSTSCGAFQLSTPLPVPVPRRSRSVPSSLAMRSLPAADGCSSDETETGGGAAAMSRRGALRAVASSVAGIALVGLLPTNANAAIDLSAYSDGPRGIKYLVTKEAETPDAPSPQRAQKVKANYVLTLGGFTDDGGTEIDRSKDILGKDKPFVFTAGIGEVIKGWDLAILDMKEGEARRLVIPAELAYGDSGAGNIVPPGATLYFEMELVAVGYMKPIRVDQETWLEENPL